MKIDNYNPKYPAFMRQSDIDAGFVNQDGSINFAGIGSYAIDPEKGRIEVLEYEGPDEETVIENYLVIPDADMAKATAVYAAGGQVSICMHAYDYFGLLDGSEDPIPENLEEAVRMRDIMAPLACGGAMDMALEYPVDGSEKYLNIVKVSCIKGLIRVHNGFAPNARSRGAVDDPDAIRFVGCSAVLKDGSIHLDCWPESATPYSEVSHIVSETMWKGIINAPENPEDTEDTII